jgi:hypothetical protein
MMDALKAMGVVAERPDADVFMPSEETMAASPSHTTRNFQV